MGLPDYNDLFDRYEWERQRELDRLPKCRKCENPIQDDYLYCIDDELICERCLNENFRKETDDYIE